MRDKVKNVLGFTKAAWLVWRNAPGLMVANLLVVGAQSLLPLATIYLTKLIVDTVTQALGNPAQEFSHQYVLALVGLAGLVALISGAADSLGALLRNMQGRTVKDRLHGVMHQKAVEADLDHYDNPAYHDKMYRTQYEIGYRPPLIVDGLISLARNSFSLIAILGLITAFSWWIAVLLMSACVPEALVRWKYGRILHEWQKRRTPDERRAWFFHHLLTWMSFAKEVRIYELGGMFKDRYQQLQSLLRKENNALISRRAMFEIGAKSLSTAAFFTAYAFITVRTMSGHLTIGDMVMFYQAFYLAQHYFKSAMKDVVSLYEDNLFLTSFYEFLDLETTVKERRQATALPSVLRQGVEFNDLHFSYPAQHSEVLKGVRMKLKPGAIVAVVGENGSGKTTLLKLLCRFYDPDRGNITIDGVDLRELRLQELRKRLSVVFQDFAKYPFTVTDNIRFGDIHSPQITARIKEAALKAGADRMIVDLPFGYETILSKFFQDGRDLSAGEWQKIALSRFLYKDAQIIALDEPTSNLDPVSENTFFRELRASADGKAIMVLSHKPMAMELADYVYVLHDGKIIEEGTHKELIKFGGRYCKLLDIA